MVEENRRLCVTSIKRFFDEDGNLLPINEWTEEMSAQVASIEIVKRNQTPRGTAIKVKFWNKNQALELMHKHLRLLEERDPNAGQPDVPAFVLPPGSKVSIT
jgi:phage terminase small subunit